MVKFVNIGFGNVVAASRIVAILAPSSAPMKRLKDEAKRLGKLIDATQGRKTRAIIITDSDHIILSGIQVETITHRINSASLDIVSSDLSAEQAGRNLDTASDMKKASGEGI